MTESQAALNDWIGALRTAVAAHSLTTAMGLVSIARTRRGGFSRPHDPAEFDELVGDYEAAVRSGRWGDALQVVQRLDGFYTTVERKACPRCPHCIASGAFGLIDPSDPALKGADGGS